MYVCVCVYVCMYTHMCMCVYVQLYVCINMYCILISIISNLKILHKYSTLG